MSNISTKASGLLPIDGRPMLGFRTAMVVMGVVCDFSVVGTGIVKIDSSKDTSIVISITAVIIIIAAIIIAAAIVLSCKREA